MEQREAAPKRILRCRGSGPTTGSFARFGSTAQYGMTEPGSVDIGLGGGLVLTGVAGVRAVSAVDPLRAEHQAEFLQVSHFDGPARS